MGKTHGILMGLGLGLGLAGCAPPPDKPPPVIMNPQNTQTLSPEMAFFHDDEVGDIFADGRQVPADVGARLHACGKVHYATLGRILASRGVNLNNPDPDSAGGLYMSGANTLGQPNYLSRTGESYRNTTGGITRLYDILIAAADEMIANMPMHAECQVGGQGAHLFDATGCNADGFSCLLGQPVAPDGVQISLCNDMLKEFGADTAQGQRLAVAAMAAPVFLCD